MSNIVYNFLREKMESQNKTKTDNNKRTIDETLEACLDSMDKIKLGTNIVRYRSDRISPEIFITVNYDENLKSPYISTANTKVPMDLSGSAQYALTFNFLFLKLEDGNTFIEHLKDGSIEAKSIISQYNYSKKTFEELVDLANRLFETASPVCTDFLLPQVFFKVSDEDYHLLSIMPNSSLMFAVTGIISKDKKREDKNNYRVYKSLFSRKFGGSKPQNISPLASNNKTCFKTTHYVLGSLPPLIEETIITPSNNFFFNCMNRTLKNNYYKTARDFEKLSAALKLWKFNDKKIAVDIVKQIAEKCFSVRNMLKNSKEEGWTSYQTAKEIPIWQKIWIDEKFYDVRSKNNSNDWEDHLANDFGTWMCAQYSYYKKENYYELSSDDKDFFIKIFKNMLLRKRG